MPGMERGQEQSRHDALLFFDYTRDYLRKIETNSKACPKVKYYLFNWRASVKRNGLLHSHFHLSHLTYCCMELQPSKRSIHREEWDRRLHDVQITKT
jgi:hypothetical protein